MVTLSIGKGFLIKLPKLYKPARHPLANIDICKPFWARAFGLWTETEEQTPQHEISIFSELKLHWLPILFCLLKLSKGRTGNGHKAKWKRMCCAIFKAHFKVPFQGEWKPLHDGLEDPFPWDTCYPVHRPTEHMLWFAWISMLKMSHLRLSCCFSLSGLWGFSSSESFKGSSHDWTAFYSVQKNLIKLNFSWITR